MMWRRILGEPVAFTGVLRAGILMLMAYGFTVTDNQLVSTMLFAELVLGFFARQTSTPMSTLPPGVAGQIADDKAVKAAQRDADVPPLR